MSIETIFHQLIRPIQARMSQIVARGIVTLMNKSTLQVQFHKEDTQDGIERVEPFGFYSNPGANPEALILFPAGFRAAGVAIALTRKEAKRPELPGGSACMSAQDGTAVIVETGGRVAIQNETNELISVLIDLIDKINAVSVPIPTVNHLLKAPNGPVSGSITIEDGALSAASKEALDSIKNRLKTFQGGVNHA
jgi:phage gp45-like